MKTKRNKHSTLATSNPLEWPKGHDRTPVKEREHNGRFQLDIDEAQDELLKELRLLGARYGVLSTNRETKKNGGFYINDRDPEDVGVAVYFDLDGENICIPCDKWASVRDNILAIVYTIRAMRSIARHGTGAMMRRSFHAFKTLPAGASDWRTVLGVGSGAVSLEEVKKAYREAAKRCHSDLGGDDSEMTRLNLAWENAKAELGK